MVFRRFIPAGAGNTGWCLERLTVRTVYPRWRGEHIFKYFSDRAMCGLSPLARGTPATVIFYMFNLRFIPAGAGNTEKNSTLHNRCPVYPRWRGEHRDSAFKHVRGGGLSPLARGTLGSNSFSHNSLRFIPAGAGNTVIPQRIIYGTTVYPRWRGEHPLSLKFRVARSGLSPLARGTLRNFSLPEKFNRFIPAGAGNTQ